MGSSTRDGYQRGKPGAEDRPMTIASILESKTGDVISVPPDMPVADVVALLAARRIGAVPVVDGGVVAGVFSERDVLYGLAEEGAAVLARPVGEVMTAPAVTVTGDVAILAGLSLMTRRRIRHLPVVEGDRMIGIVSIGDLVKRRIDQIEADVEAMRSYIQGS
jgi:CBS domain-containing protein